MAGVSSGDHRHSSCWQPVCVPGRRQRSDGDSNSGHASGDGRLVVPVPCPCYQSSASFYQPVMAMRRKVRYPSGLRQEPQSAAGHIMAMPCQDIRSHSFCCRRDFRTRMEALAFDISTAQRRVFLLSCIMCVGHQCLGRRVPVLPCDSSPQFSIIFIITAL